MPAILWVLRQGLRWALRWAWSTIETPVLLVGLLVALVALVALLYLLPGPTINALFFFAGWGSLALYYRWRRSRSRLTSL